MTNRRGRKEGDKGVSEVTVEASLKTMTSVFDDGVKHAANCPRI